MALDFPDAPTIGQTYVGSGGSVWTWDGVKWLGGAPVATGGLVTASQIDYDTLRLTAVGTKLKALGPISQLRNWPNTATTNPALDAAHNLFTGTGNAVWNLPPVVVGMCLTIMVEGSSNTTTIVPAGSDQILCPGASPVGAYTNAAPLIIPAQAGLTNQSITLDGIGGTSPPFWVARPSPAIAEAMGWVMRPYFKGSFSGGTSGFSPNTWTKNAMTMEVDSHGWWDAANYRYTPQRPGRYRATYQAQLGDNTSVSVQEIHAAIYISGSPLDQKYISWNGASYLPVISSVSVTTIAHLNGSTDYLEPFMYVNAAAPKVFGPSLSSFIVTYLGP